MHQLHLTILTIDDHTQLPLKSRKNYDGAVDVDEKSNFKIAEDGVIKKSIF